MCCCSRHDTQDFIDIHILALITLWGGQRDIAQRGIIYIKTPIPLRPRAVLLIITQGSSCKPGLSPANHMWLHLFTVKETEAHVRKQRNQLEQVGKLPRTRALCLMHKRANEPPSGAQVQQPVRLPLSDFKVFL